MKGKFFYNFSAMKNGDYNKFNFGIIDIECDDDKDIVDEAFTALKEDAASRYPDADNINITAFNRV